MCDCSVVQEERGSGTKRDKWDGLEGGDATATNQPASHGRTICFGLGFLLSQANIGTASFFIRMTKLFLQTAGTEAMEATLTFEVIFRSRRQCVIYENDSKRG